MVNIRDLIDDAQCYGTVRGMRWPGLISRPHCSSGSVIGDGRDDTRPYRQRDPCHGRHKRFDDPTGATFAGHHEPPRAWVVCLSFMGLDLSGWPTAGGLDMDRDDVQAMARQPLRGVVDRRPAVAPEGEVECDEDDLVAGHEGSPVAVKKEAEPADADV